MYPSRFNKPACPGLDPGANLTRSRGYHGNSLKQRAGQPAGNAGSTEDGGVGAMDRQHQGSFGRNREARGNPVVRMEEIGASGQFSLGGQAKLPPQAGQSTPPDRPSQQGRKAAVARDCVLEGPRNPHPMDRDAINDRFTGGVAGSDHP